MQPIMKDFLKKVIQSQIFVTPIKKIIIFAVHTFGKTICYKPLKNNELNNK